MAADGFRGTSMRQVGLASCLSSLERSESWKQGSISEVHTSYFVLYSVKRKGIIRNNNNNDQTCHDRCQPHGH